ncbi:serine/threonine protein kinase [Caballeronia terrestris]|uniref:Serine/threonine protein kinase n=1 Tax=Caballeronia terrestris TaxID=1226301 RepID=A0A158KF47_9BURK|nr:serine/threonine-protein kinase [Caballeronia terrestris]SAL79180.1 serine/threonine protein kinase [Caballeronia terrestris]
MSEPGQPSDVPGGPPPEEDKTVIVSRPRLPADVDAWEHAAGQNVLPTGTRLGEFEILGLIGEGGFGIVYRAHDTSLGRDVALKEYMPSALAARVTATQVQVKSERHEGTFRAGLKSFINEARILAQFDHPSLVKVYRFWEANGTAYMVMPLYRGATLKEALKSMRSPPDEKWLRALLAPLLNALTVLHTSNCYHRDIAPDNIILLADSHRPVLLDFGAARRVIGDMTQALTVILKPGYAPLEQYAEVPSLKQGAWSDHYALAALVYFAILGKTPPPSVGRMVKDSYQPLGKLAAGRYSERFLRAIDHALAVMPADRPQTVEQFARELGIELEAKAEDAQRGAGNATARRRVMIVGAVALLGGAGAAAWLWHSRTAINAPQITAATPASSASAPQALPASPVEAASAAPPPPPPPPLPPFTVEDEFARVATLADPTIHLKADVSVPRAVIDRDKLRFSLTSNRAGYVYVFVVDPAGQCLLLFPNELDHDNQIAPAKRLVLPRPSWPMQAGEPVGANHFLAIVSATPRDFPGLGMTHESVFASVPPAALQAAAEQRTASTSPFAGTASCDGKAPDCAHQYGAATFKIDVVKSSK